MGHVYLAYIAFRSIRPDSSDQCALVHRFPLMLIQNGQQAVFLVGEPDGVCTAADCAVIRRKAECGCREYGCTACVRPENCFFQCGDRYRPGKRRVQNGRFRETDVLRIAEPCIMPVEYKYSGGIFSVRQTGVCFIIRQKHNPCADKDIQPGFKQRQSCLQKSVCVPVSGGDVNLHWLLLFGAIASV